MKKLAIWAMAAACAAGWALGEGMTPQLTTQFGMQWFADEVPDTESEYYAGGAGLVSFPAGGATNRWTDPNTGETSDVTFATADGGLVMTYFAYGQPLESDIAQYGLGDVIPPPDGAIRGVAPSNFVAVRVGNNDEAYWINATGSAIWLPSRDELVAATGGNIEIQWQGVEQSVVYTVASVPTNRPSRIYWTEAPYNAPAVYLSANNQQVYVTLHYNNYVTPPTQTVVTNWDVTGTNEVTSTNFTDGVWIEAHDGSQCLRAEGVEGIFLLEYYEDGKYEKSLGVQPIQVLAPTVERVAAEVGDRLLPVDRYYGTEDLTPKVTAGITGGGTGDKMFMVDGNSAFKDKLNWLYAIRSTEDSPWDAEVYWEHTDDRGVTWPFEVDWYEIEWPADAIRVVHDNQPNGLLGAKSYMPAGMSVQIASQATEETPKKEASNALLASGNSALEFKAPGLALMRYSTTSNLWHEPVRGVLHDDPAEFDPTSVKWPIGKEIQPFSDENYVTDLDGEDDYGEGTHETKLKGKNPPFTVEAWAYLGRNDGTEHPVVSHYGSEADEFDDLAWELGYTKDGKAYFETPLRRLVGEVPGKVRKSWHHLAGTRTADGMMALYVDGKLAGELDGSSIEMQDKGKTRHIQIGRSLKTGAYFGGRIDEVRYWNVARSGEEILANMKKSIRTAQPGLLECYPMNEGAGRHIHDTVDGSYGTLYGEPKWIASFHLADHSHLKDLAAYPGFVYSGSAYNVGTYDYPGEWASDPQSALFAVNTNAFEIWWSRPSRNNGEMPYPLHYPSLSLHYESVWPTNAPEIVIASGLGSGGMPRGETARSLYWQNIAGANGYNPNEEHAVLVGNTAYALRDDLNQADSSEPYVLVNTADAEGKAKMAVYRVRRTNEQYQFRYATQAGAAVNPPMPLAAWEGCESTTNSAGPGWRDRKKSWWAKAAGKDGGNTNIVMHFFYPMQTGFHFPKAASQPEPGTELPWLPDDSADGGLTGTPIDNIYDVDWPVNVPEMAVGQTLAEATGGLPDIWNQASVEIVFQQSVTNGHGDSVVLYDPAIEKGRDLPKTVVTELSAAGKARKEATSKRYRFGDVSPMLEERLFYDPDRGADGQLVLSGMLRKPLTGTPYVLPNWLSAEEQAGLLALGEGLSASSKTAWENAVKGLPLAKNTPVGPNDAYVNAALSSAPPTDKDAHGYVALVFNNSTNTGRVPSGLPISFQIIRVSTNLWGAQYLDVIEPDNALEEKLTLVYPNDFGGEAGNYEFDWRWAVPSAGNKPSTPEEEWTPYFETGTSNGASSIVIQGGTAAGTLFMLSDHYFAVRYRRIGGKGPSGNAWSPWVSTLAPGWIERVMTAINPYDQRFSDMAEYEPGLWQSIIEQCGPPYEGAVALNEEAVNEAGLIQIYQTVMDRALSLSLKANATDPNCNDSLLFAATRLNKLYMALGNEAYADAMDPTVRIDPDTEGWYDDYASLDTTLFCFQNQVGSLLEEELALLRGRDDSRSPSVTVTPVYNRLIWNYTYGIDGGEVAYACNYDIKGVATNTTGNIGPEDAKRMYPQGHGDAWGHYLSALAPYYTLLAYTNFGWNTIPGATLVGNATVGVDYFDEEAFALAAAAKARTGAEVVGLTARRDYAFGAKGLERWTPDTDTNRCWDVDGWAARAGQGAYFDWAVANSLLLDTVTNLMQVGADDAPATGLNVIDRDHVPAIGEVAAALGDIQSRLDRADAGMNPLGLDENTIPFDLSASELDAGKGHFEQAYERALGALRSAKKTFAAAQEASAALRKQYDSATEAVSAAQQEEIALKHRLIEIFGYPYADDIGPSGSYAQGYDGPDLINYMILDLDENFGPVPTGDTNVTVKVTEIVASTNNFNTATNTAYNLYDVTLWANKYSAVSNSFMSGITYTNTNVVVSVVRSFNAAGLQVKPEGWTGRRRAQGEIQAALYDFVEAYYGFLKAGEELKGRQAGLEDEYTMLMTDIGIAFQTLDDNESVADKEKLNLRVKAGVNYAAEFLNLLADTEEVLVDAAAEGMPGILATIFGGIVSKPVESAMKVVANIAWTVAKIGTVVMKGAAEADNAVKEQDIIDLQEKISKNTALGGIQKESIQFLGDLADQYPLIREVQARLVAMQAAMERVAALEAEGERVLEERAMARNRIAQRLEGARYADMMYRTYRNETMQRYSGMLERAAQAAWRAAMAYDYETGLLDAGTENTAASRFLEKIVRARTLGPFADDEPQTAGAEGDGGLADALARLKADWDVVKPRWGINNPDSATTRFSLRRELFRISSADAGSNKTWQDALALCYTNDLGQVDAYRRYCVPYGAGTNAGPGLVIPFHGEITAGQNFFGWPMGGGDNVYDPTWLSTRIRAVGVWFSGYNNSFNTNSATGEGLANTPNVYLVPAGVDTVVNGADRTRTSLRTWTVFDQAMPLAFDIGEAGDPVTRSAERRRHPAFRAHHDKGTFSDDELCSNARLVGRSVWNSEWVLIIPGRSLLADPEEGINRFIYGPKQANGERVGTGVTDIQLYFKTYSYGGD